MSAIAFLNMQAERRVPKITAESHALFLAREAVSLGDQSETLRKAILRLCASDNPAIANAGFQLLRPLRMKP